MIMKIKISAILPIAIILSMLKVFSVSATSEISENNFTYSVINDSNCVVTKYDGEASDISIPEMVNGKTVSGIASKAFSLNQSIISVSMPDSIEFIGDRAFTDCKNLSSISFSDKITEIEHNAFNGCISLKAVSLPKELQQIGSSAFRNCTKLADIRFNSKFNSVGYDAFTNTKWYDDQKDGYIYFTNVLYGYKGNMPENEVLEIPKSITCIAECALEDQPNLKNVVFNDNLASIGWGAFQNTGIEELNLPLVSAIEDSTFYNCSKLRSVIIPDSVETIGYAAFENCPLLSDVKIQNGSLDFIDMSAFLDCNSLKKIYIPKSVTRIGQWAFGYITERWDDCDEVDVKPTDFTISGYAGTAAEEYAKKNGFTFISLNDETVTKNEDFVYELNDDGTATITEYLSSDDEITFPSEIDGYKVTAIGENILATWDSVYYKDNNSYHKIKSVIIENGITTIKESAFYNCRDLSYVSLPNTLTEIEPAAFWGCVSLTDITVPKNTDISCSFLGNSVDFDDYNPDSDTYFIKYTDGMVIRGYENSSAQTYARLYHFTFIPLDNETTQPTEETTSPDTSETTQPDEPSKPTLRGDVDLNGFVELADLTALSKYLLSPSAFPLKNAVAKANADMNGDGLINIVDLSELIENQLGK